jgi:lysophospholipase L1-like esterase
MTNADRRHESGRLTCLRIGFFGTSIMQHLEAFSPRLVDQMNLPEVGETVEITERRARGYVHGLALYLQARWPHVRVEVRNHGYSGATTRKLVEVVAERLEVYPCHFDLLVFSGGINDVWRRFQARHSEAVDIDEYEGNYRKALNMLTQNARRVICLTETPVEATADAPMNAELARYNAVAARVAQDLGVQMLDIWTPFLAQAEWRRMSGAPSLWSDGVHLSEHGDATLVMLIETTLRKGLIIEHLLDQSLDATSDLSPPGSL